MLLSDVWRYPSVSRRIFLMLFSILLRGTRNSLEQPIHLSLKSMPERSTSISLQPQGCFFFISRISPTRTSTAVPTFHRIVPYYYTAKLSVNQYNY